MTKKQQKLMSEIEYFFPDSEFTTHDLAVKRGDLQAYESNLRDRLLKLELDSRPGQIRGFIKPRLWKIKNTQEHLNACKISR